MAQEPMDARRAMEIQGQLDEAIERTEAETLTFQADVLRFLERMSAEEQRRSIATASRELRRAKAAYDKVRAFLDRQQRHSVELQQTAATAPAADDETDGVDGGDGDGDRDEDEETVVRTPRGALRWLARLMKALAELLRAGFDKMFVEVNEFVGRVSAEQQQVQAVLEEQIEQEQVARIVQRASRQLARIEAAGARGSSAAKSAVERLQGDVALLRECHPHNADAVAFVARADAAMARMPTAASAPRQQQRNAELRRYREAAAAVRAEADAAQRELQEAIAAAERATAAQVDSAAALSSFARFRRNPSDAPQ